MAFNGSGTFARLYNWVNDRNSLINITASRMDAEMDGIATGLSSCLLKDGTQTVTANIPMATFKFTGLGAGTGAGESVRYEQVVLLSAGASQTITRSAAGTVLTLESTDAGAGGAPFLDLYRNSASPAVNDTIGAVNFYGKDSGGTQTLYAQETVLLSNVTDASEGASIVWSTVAAGTYANRLYLSGTNLYPATNDGLALGVSGNAFADLFLASGAVVNFNAGNYTITHTAGDLLFSGTVSIGNADTTLARSAAGQISIEGGAGSLYAATIELGAAADTTLARSAAGQMSIEGGAGSLYAATIELGAASDTTLSRVSAGVIAVEGATVRTGTVAVNVGGTGQTTAQLAFEALAAGAVSIGNITGSGILPVGARLLGRQEGGGGGTAFGYWTVVS